MHVSYRYLLIIILVAALLCLMPARGADAPNEKKPQTAAAQSVESAEAPAGADLSAQTNRETYLHRTLYYAPCGHSVQRREKLPAQLVGLTRGALEKEIGGLYESAAVTGFSAGEVDITTSSSARRAQASTRLPNWRRRNFRNTTFRSEARFPSRGACRTRLPNW